MLVAPPHPSPLLPLLFSLLAQNGCTHVPTHPLISMPPPPSHASRDSLLLLLSLAPSYLISPLQAPPLPPYSKKRSRLTQARPPPLWRNGRSVIRWSVAVTPPTAPPSSRPCLSQPKSAALLTAQVNLRRRRLFCWRAGGPRACGAALPPLVPPSPPPPPPLITLVRFCAPPSTRVASGMAAGCSLVTGCCCCAIGWWWSCSRCSPMNAGWRSALLLPLLLLPRCHERTGGAALAGERQAGRRGEPCVYEAEEERGGEQESFGFGGGTCRPVE